MLIFSIQLLLYNYYKCIRESVVLNRSYHKIERIKITKYRSLLKFLSLTTLFIDFYLYTLITC